MLARIVTTLTLLASLTGLASAQAVQAPGTTLSAVSPYLDQPDGATTEHVRYGTKILLADGAGLALLFAGGAANSDAVTLAGLGVMWLGPAAIHAREGNLPGAVGSALLRPALVTAGFAAGAAAANCPSDDPGWFCGLGEMALGGLIGYGAAAIIDAGFLARTTRRLPVDVSPRVAASSAGFQVGLGGSF